jgi:hypothetical protein
MLSQWFRRNPPSQQGFPSSRSVRLQLQQLEDRTTPADGFVLSNNALIPLSNFLSSPGIQATSIPPIGITGIIPNQQIVSIDYRPQRGNLYGLGYNPIQGSVQLYTINTKTGVAAPVGTSGTFVDGSGNPVRIGVNGTTAIEMDFNPAVDRIRVVTSTGQNFRMNPNTGAFIDGDLGGASGSVAGLNMDGPINGPTTTVSGIAYSNNFVDPRAITTLYTLDPVTNSLYIQNSPNSGTQTNPIPLRQVIQQGNSGVSSPLDISAVLGFDFDSSVIASASNSPVTPRARSSGDLSGTAIGFAILTVGGTTGLYSITVAGLIPGTGLTELIGTIPNSTPVQGLAFQPLAIQTQILVSGGNTVKVLNLDGSVKRTLNPFGTSFPGTVSVAQGDVNGDGVFDYITAAGRGGGPHVKVFDGVTFNLINSFFAYVTTFTGGVSVAAADTTGDGVAEIITGAGPGGGPHVRIFNLQGQVQSEFFAYSLAFTGGVNVAAGSLDGIPGVEIVTGAGAGGGPNVRTFTPQGRMLGNFLAYAANFTGGVFVSVDSSVAQIITGPGAGRSPEIGKFDLSGRFSPITEGAPFNLLAYDFRFKGGVRVSSLSGSGTRTLFGDNAIIVGPGAGGGPNVRIITKVNSLNSRDPGIRVQELPFPFDPTFLGGVFVA